MTPADTYPVLSFEASRAALDAALEADVPMMLLGAPGVGKSALVEAVATAHKLPARTLLGSTVDPTDVGGIPVPRAQGVDRVPLRLIRDCADAPALLFLDELSCSPPAVQAALLRLILCRAAGDVTLHADTRVVAAANPPEQAPGGWELSAPLVGRLTIVQLVPTLPEVRTYFREILPARDPAVADLARDFAATAEVEAGLIQLDPPSASVTAGAPWGAPRNWERGLRGMARAKADEVQRALLGGAVGEEQATAYLAIRKLREHLPSADAIARDPSGARVPDERERQIAALGLLAYVADRDPWAAWIYTARLADEIAAAAARMLGSMKANGAPAKHRTEGARARVKVLAKIGAALEGSEIL